MTVFSSATPDIDIPAVTLSELIEAACERGGAQPALVEAESGRSVSYADLSRAVHATAQRLRARGVGYGTVVAIVAPNSIDWLVAALGVIAAGGTVTGANPGYVTEELAHQLDDAHATLALVSPDCLDAVAAAAAGVRGRCAVELLDAVAAGSLADPGADAEPGDRGARSAGLDDVAVLPFSSGTTGRSKGVRLTHRNLVANISQVAEVAPIDAGDRVLAFLPFFHIMGFSVVALGGLVKGATLVVLPGFEPRTFLTAIETHRVRSFFVVPPVANFLVNHPLVDEFDLSSVETVGCGAAPLGIATEDALRSRLGCQMAQGYGMTESSGCISYPHFTTGESTGASGALLPNTEAVIVDPVSGQRLGAGATGEVWFRGPQVFSGYLDNPEATAATIDTDGWVHTGDLGHVDAAGLLHITDRLKELIKVKGFQVAPAELEALLLTHPAVLDAAVIGRPDDRAGERPVAYVVPAPGQSTDGLVDWVAERVSDHKRIAEVILTDAIPRNPSGKVLRRLLRAPD